MFNVQSPRTDDGAIEQDIQAKGLTAPRVTPADIEANIFVAYYFTGDEAVKFAGQNGSPFVPHPALKLLTFCVLVLRNGFTVTGESACASPENFDADVGRKIARQNAVQKVWSLMGYELRSKLALFPGGIESCVRPRMHLFVGSKAIRATPMTRQKYNDLRGWHVPSDENPADEGMLVEYLDGGKANVDGFEGYVSWSPLDVFNRAYKAI